jgi:hypothetical protein
MTLVELGTARHVIPPSTEVDKEVVVAASSDVTGTATELIPGIV